MRARTDVNRYWFWLLSDANRWLIVGVLAVGVFLAFVLFGLLKSVPLRTTMASGDMVETLFAGMIGAIITGTTLVVTINQLVLSQEIGSLGNQRSRMDSTLDVRRSTDDLFGETTPAEPAAYLDALIATTERRADKLREALDGSDQQSLREHVDAYVSDLQENADTARRRLGDGDFGTFDVLAPALDFNYDRKMTDLHRIAMAESTDLSDEQRAAVDELFTAITLYGVVRDYVKGLYIQWALVKLSRAILYAALVSLVVAGGMIVFVDATTFTGTLFGVEQMLLVVSAAFTLSTLPFLVFMSFILRLATVAKQTLSMGPLVLR